MYWLPVTIVYIVISAVACEFLCFRLEEETIHLVKELYNKGIIIKDNITDSGMQKYILAKCVKLQLVKAYMLYK